MFASRSRCFASRSASLHQSDGQSTSASRRTPTVPEVGRAGSRLSSAGRTQDSPALIGLSRDTSRPGSIAGSFASTKVAPQSSVWHGHRIFLKSVAPPPYCVGNRRAVRPSTRPERLLGQTTGRWRKHEIWPDRPSERPIERPDSRLSGTTPIRKMIRQSPRQRSRAWSRALRTRLWRQISRRPTPRPEVRSEARYREVRVCRDLARRCDADSAAYAEQARES